MMFGLKNLFKPTKIEELSVAEIAIHDDEFEDLGTSWHPKSFRDSPIECDLGDLTDLEMVDHLRGNVFEPLECQISGGTR